MDAAAAFLRRALRRGPAHSTAATATATTATATTTTTAGTSSGDRQDDSLLQFGVTEKLLALVRGFTVETFKNCDLSTSDVEDDGQSVPDNVRKDLTDWQERHAILILSKVKEISQLRYVLCPRHLKERQFWRIYFALVKNLVAPYELWAMQESKLQKNEARNKDSMSTGTYEVEMTESKPSGKSSLLEIEDEGTAIEKTVPYDSDEHHS